MTSNKQLNTIRNGALLLIVAALLLTACGGAKPKTYTIGVACLSPTIDPAFDGFKAGMVEAGYVEGQNVTYVYDGPVSTIDDLDAVIENLMAKDLDLIFTLSTPAASKAKAAVAGKGIPVVFSVVSDPVGSKIVDSLTHPGGDITGVRVGGSIAKQLDLLLSMAPGTTRLYTPHNPEDGGAVQSMVELSAAAPSLGIEPVIVEVRTADELNAALAAVPSDVDAIFLLGSGFLNTQFTQYVDTAIAHKLPLASVSPLFDRGVLMSYGHDYHRDGQQAARLADLVLKGTPPGDLPVETADFFLGINLQTAQTIGLDIPDAILAQADDVAR